MKKIFINILLSLFLINSSHAQNTASLYGININVPPNFIPLKTNTKRFMIWDRMSYQVPEVEAKTVVNQYLRDMNASKDNELIFLGNEKWFH